MPVSAKCQSSKIPRKRNFVFYTMPNRVGVKRPCFRFPLMTPTQFPDKGEESERHLKPLLLSVFGKIASIKMLKALTEFISLRKKDLIFAEEKRLRNNLFRQLRRWRQAIRRNGKNKNRKTQDKRKLIEQPKRHFHWWLLLLVSWPRRGKPRHHFPSNKKAISWQFNSVFFPWWNREWLLNEKQCWSISHVSLTYISVVQCPPITAVILGLRTMSTAAGQHQLSAVYQDIKWITTDGLSAEFPWNAHQQAISQVHRWCQRLIKKFTLQK